MARRNARPVPDQQLTLPVSTTACPECGPPLGAAYTNRRTAVALDGLVRLAVQVRRCRGRDCGRCGRSVRPEAEGRLALPHHEFGLDVIALISTLRYTQHRSIPEIHAELVRRGVAIGPRTVTNLLDRSDELLALSLADDRRLPGITAAEGR